jgi:hypothetical protein
VTCVCVRERKRERERERERVSECELEVLKVGLIQREVAPRLTLAVGMPPNSLSARRRPAMIAVGVNCGQSHTSPMDRRAGKV